MQGWRKNQEDAHIAELDFVPGMSLFAVFDGHGGAEVSAYCSKHFVKTLKENKDFQNGNYEKALQDTFVKLDTILAMTQGGGECKNPVQTQGTTANVVLVTKNKIFCANVGDSRAIVNKDGKAVALSWDHKPSIPSEKERIEKADHRVEGDRVDGGLAMSRALGDWQYKSGKLPVKEMAVSSFPDIKQFKIEKDTKYLVTACDGIWDVMDN